MKIGPKLKELLMFKGQFYVYSIFEVFLWNGLYFVTFVDTKQKNTTVLVNKAGNYVYSFSIQIWNWKSRQN